MATLACSSCSLTSVGRVDVARRLGEDGVDLHRGAARAVAAHVLRDLVGEVLGADEVEHRALGMRAGHHERRAQRLAADERHAGDAPALDVDRGHRRTGADRRPGSARAGGDRLGDRAHAAAHVAPGALHAVDLAERVVQQVVGGPRRVGTGPDADDAAGGVGALELVGLEVVVEQVADRHRHEPEDVGQVAAAHARRATGLAQQLEDVAGPLGARRRGRAQHQRLEEERRLLEQRVEGRQRVGVLARDARDLLVGDLLVVGQQDRAPVGGEGRELGVERDRVIAELRQLEVGHDLRLEHRDHVGGARDALAGPQLLGHARAAEDVARLEDAHAQAGARQVGGGGEAVVPAADDDRVVVRPAAVAVAVERAHDPTSTAPASASM